MSIRSALDSLLDALQAAGVPFAACSAEGLSRGDIAGKVTDLPGHLASEVVDYFKWRNGLRPDRETDFELFPSGIPLSLDEAIVHYRMARSAAEQIARDTGLPASSLWNECWLPLFHNGAGDFHVTLLGPGPADTAPVYTVANEDREAAALAYDSLAALMRTVGGCWKAGAFAPAAGGLIDEDRRAAAEIIRAHNPERTKRAMNRSNVDALVRGLADPDGNARGRAAKSLISLRDLESVPMLMTALRHHDDGVRFRAAQILAELGDARAVGGLIQALDDPEDMVVKMVAGSLGLLKAAAAIEPLIHTMSHSNQQVRATAAWSLGELKAEAARGVLLEAAQDRLGMVRDAAATALMRLGDRTS